MSLRQVAPCVLLAKQVAATRRLFGAHAVISYEGECELVFLFNMADHMTLSHWFIYILSQRLIAGSVHTMQQLCFPCANFVAAISRTNSNWLEFVRLITATKFCRSDNDFHEINRVTQGELLWRLVPATSRSDLSPSVSRP